MEVLSQILEILNAILSGWLMLMLVYQLVITFFGYKRNTKDYQDHAPLMRFLVLVPAHNEEAVIGDIVQNLNEMEYPREMYDFYILADNCTDRTAEIARGLGGQRAGKLEGQPGRAYRQAHRAAKGPPDAGGLSEPVRSGHVFRRR